MSHKQAEGLAGFFVCALALYIFRASFGDHIPFELMSLSERSLYEQNRPEAERITRNKMRVFGIGAFLIGVIMIYSAMR